MAKVTTPPAGYHSVTPYLAIRDAVGGSRVLPARIWRRARDEADDA